VLEKWPDVRFAYLFGSRGGGRPHGASDVDVAIYLERGRGEAGGVADPASSRGGASGGEPLADGGVTDGGAAGSARLDSWTRLHGDLVEALAETPAETGLRDRGHAPEGVDLVILNDAPPLLADRVIRRGELLFSRSEPERLRWVVRAKSRYCDLRPLRRRLDEAVSERLRSGRFGRSQGGDSDGKRAAGGEGEGAGDDAP
jgi:predicted nucleotidyltransferase